MLPPQNMKTPITCTTSEYFRGNDSNIINPIVRVSKDNPLAEISHSSLFFIFVGAYHI